MASIQQTNVLAGKNEFLAQLYKFHEQNGTPMKKIPVVGGEPVNMYQLYAKVVEMGGFSKVTRDKQWNEIAQLFYQKHDVLNAGYLLKQHYIRFLMKFELTMKSGSSMKPLKSVGKSSVTHPLVITPLNNSNVPLTNAPESPINRGLGSIAIEPDTHVRNISGGFLSTDATSLLAMHRTLDLVDEPAYYKLVLSLKSGLPNEVDFAFNTLLMLSFDESNPLLLSSVPSLLDLILAHVGIFDEFNSGIKALHETWTKTNWDVNYCQFWQSSVPNHVWSALMAVEHPVRFDRTQELFHPYCGTGESTIESYRAAQVSNILRNLSFEKKNVVILGDNKLLLNFVVLCMNCILPSVMCAGYEIAMNIASVLRLSKAAENVASHLFIDTVVSAVNSGDRLQVIRGMEILGELAWCIDNAELLAKLPDEVYRRIIFCTLVPDMEMLYCCFETLYSLSSLDQEVTDRISNTPYSIRLLVQFLTFESELFKQKAVNKLEIETPASNLDKQTSPTVTPGFANNITVSPAQPLANYISAASPAASVNAQPNQSFSLSKPFPGRDGNFVSKWLKSHYEEVRGGMLSRTELMQDFQNYCARFGNTSGYTLMQLLRFVKMLFPSSYTRRIFDSNDAPQYVIGGLRKKLIIQWNLPSVVKKPNVLPSAAKIPLSVLSSDSKQLSSNDTTNELKRNMSKSMNFGDNYITSVRSSLNSSTVLHNKTNNVLSNIINSRSTRSILPATSVNCCTFNFITRSIHSSKSTNQHVSGEFSTASETVHSLIHNGLLKGISPAGSQTLKLNTSGQSKASPNSASMESYHALLNSTSSSLNTSQISLLNWTGNEKEIIVNSQPDANETNSKVYCYWAECKRYFTTYKELFMHCVTQHLNEGVIKCMWQGCLFTANRTKPSMLRHLEIYHCNSARETPDIPSTASILMNLRTSPILELEEESKFTRSIRITASLVLYNLLTSSPKAIRELLKHETELAIISLSGIDCAGIVAKCVFILHNK